MAEMMEHIAHLSQDIGARPAGTEEEQRAASYIEEEFKKVGLPTATEDFTGVPASELPAVICCGASAILTLLSMVIPLLHVPALLVTVVALAVFAAEELGYSVISRFLGNGVSQNVVARHVPAASPDNAGQRRRKIVVVTRYDSGKARAELTGPTAGMGRQMKLGTMGGMAALALFALIRTVPLANAEGAPVVVLNLLSLVAIVLSIIPVATYVLHQTAQYNDAANGSASGVAVMLELARRVRMERPQAGEGAVMHGEEAVRASGMVPEGASLSYEEAPVKAPRFAPKTEAERLAAAKAAIAAISGKPVAGAGEWSWDISDNLVQVKETPVQPDEAEQQAVRDETRDAFAAIPEDTLEQAVEKARAAEQEEGQAEEAGEASAEGAYAAPASAPQAAPQAAPAVAPAVGQAAQEDDGIPDWFKNAQKKAKRSTDEKPVQRSKYASALDAAVQESSGYFSQANEVVEHKLEESLAVGKEEIVEVAPPAWALAEPAAATGAAAPSAAPAAAQVAEAAEPSASHTGDMNGAAPTASAPDEPEETSVVEALDESAAEEPVAEPDEEPAEETGAEFAAAPADEPANAPAAAESAEELAEERSVVEPEESRRDDMDVAPAPAPAAPAEEPAADPAAAADEPDAAGEPAETAVETTARAKASLYRALQEQPDLNVPIPSFLNPRKVQEEAQAAKEDGPRTGDRVQVAVNPAADTAPIKLTGKKVEAPRIDLSAEAQSESLRNAAAGKAQAQGSVAPTKRPTPRKRSIDLPSFDDVPAEAQGAMKQRAPLADLPSFDAKGAGSAAGSQGIPDNKRAALRTMIPSLSGVIASKEALANLDLPVPEETDEVKKPSLTGSFAPVSEELLKSVDSEDIYVDDVDDSDYDKDFTETGAFAGAGYVDMPTSKTSKFFSRFRRKAKGDDEASTPQEWLRVDEQFEARAIGKERGGWESFRADSEWESGETSDSDEALQGKGAFEGGEERYADDEDGSAWDDGWDDGASHGEEGVGGEDGSDHDVADRRDEDLGATTRFDPVSRQADYDELQRGSSNAKPTPRRRSWHGGAYSADDDADATAVLGAEDAAAAQEDGEAEGAAEAGAPAAGSVVAQDVETEAIIDFHGSGLPTEVWFVALGAELEGNSGMKAFLAEHAEDLRGAIVVEIDSLGAGDLSLIETEGAYRPIKASSRMKRYLRKATQASGVRCDTTSLRFEGSASSVALGRGIQAMHIEGVEGGKAALYGEMDDVLENVDADLLEERTNFLMEFLKAV